MRINLIYILVLFLCVQTVPSIAQISEPIMLFSTNGDIYQSGYIIDDNGNHYVFGKTQGDSLWYNDSLILVDKGYKGKFGWTLTDMFLFKINAQGEIIYALQGWAQGAEPHDIDGNIWPGKMVLDEGNNDILITGTVGYDTLNFGSETFRFDTSAGANLFMIRVSATGSASLVKSMKAIAPPYIHEDPPIEGEAIIAGLSVDENRNILIAGTYKTSLIIEQDTLKHTEGDTHDRSVFAIKLSADGNLLWSRSVVTKSSISCSNMVGDNIGGCYLTGLFGRDTVTFGPDTLRGSFGELASFITRVDRNGNFVWARKVSGNKGNTPIGLVVDNGSNLYIAGNYRSDSLQFGDTMVYNFKHSQLSFFLAVYDSTGQLKWVKTANGTVPHFYSPMLMSKDNSVKLHGSFNEDTLNLGSYTLVESPDLWSSSVFFAEYTATGDVESAYSVTVKNASLCDIAEMPDGGLYSVFKIFGTANINGEYYEVPHYAGTALVLYPHSRLFTNIKKDELAPFNISIFPNPSNNHFQVKLPNELIGKSIFMNLYDMTGRQVGQIRTEEASTQIDVTDLASGLYYLNIYKGDELISSHKLIKQ